MFAGFETKPTAHQSTCAICREDIRKGDYCLKAQYSGYRSSDTTRICIGCLRKGIEAGDSDG